MKQFLIKSALKVLLSLLLDRIAIKDVTDLVKEAQKLHDNAFSRRGYVLRELKRIEGSDNSTAFLNLIVEGGVYLVKYLR